MGSCRRPSASSRRARRPGLTCPAGRNKNFQDLQWYKGKGELVSFAQQRQFEKEADEEAATSANLKEEYDLSLYLRHWDFRGPCSKCRGVKAEKFGTKLLNPKPLARNPSGTLNPKPYQLQETLQPALSSSPSLNSLIPKTPRAKTLSSRPCPVNLQSPDLGPLGLSHRRKDLPFQLTQGVWGLGFMIKSMAST